MLAASLAKPLPMSLRQLLHSVADAVTPGRQPNTDCPGGRSVLTSIVEMTKGPLLFTRNRKQELPSSLGESDCWDKASWTSEDKKPACTLRPRAPYYGFRLASNSHGQTLDLPGHRLIRLRLNFAVLASPIGRHKEANRTKPCFTAPFITKALPRL